MSLKMFDENDLPGELLLTTRQKTKLRNTFKNIKSTILKLSKAQIPKLIQSEGFLGSMLSKLANTLMKVAVSLAKTVLAPLGITAAASAIDAELKQKIHVSGTTILIISNKEINDILKIVQAIEDSNILQKRFTKTIKDEIKELKEGFLSMLLGTLEGILLGNLLSEKRIVRAGSGNKKRKINLRAGYRKGWDL